MSSSYPSPSNTDPVFDLLDAIRDAFYIRLNNGIAAADLVEVAIVHGTQTVIDNCCPGYGWVRLARVFPSNTFPSPATTVVCCPKPMFAAEIELGSARCATVADDDGQITLADLEDEAVIAGLDRSAMIQTVLDDVPAATGFDTDDCEVVLGTWQPIPTSGACLGSTLTFTIPFDQCIDTIAGS